MSETYLLALSNIRSQSNIFIHMTTMMKELVALCVISSTSWISSTEVTRSRKFAKN